MGFIILRQTYNLCLRMFVCITTHLLGIHTLQHFQCKSCSKSLMSILFLYPQFTFLTWYILHVLVERTSLVKKYITLYYIYTLCYSLRDLSFVSKMNFQICLNTKELPQFQIRNKRRDFCLIFIFILTQLRWRSLKRNSFWNINRSNKAPLIKLSTIFHVEQFSW